jgi:cytochrome P450
MKNEPAPFPLTIAHHAGPHPVHGHAEAFRQATFEQGLDASSYFNQSGITALAEKNGGLCAFRLEHEWALYQSTNCPLANDEDLAPSIHANADLFGSFVGTLPVDDEQRKAKRAVVEKVLGNSAFVHGLDRYVCEAAREYLGSLPQQALPLDEFCLQLVAHIDSCLPGLLDFHQKPLARYLQCERYGRIARRFFEVASSIISKMGQASLKDADMIVDMTRDMVLANFESIEQAPATNLIRSQFACWSRPFTREVAHKLDAREWKELGTIIVATYDTTALSLLWAMTYLETCPAQKHLLLQAIATNHDPIAVAYLLVMEAIRLGGSNPTALWRRTSRPLQIQHGGNRVEIPAQTMLWLDRRHANRDPKVFPYPERFDCRNLQHLMQASEGSHRAVSLLARNRFEINSFNMVNTRRNPRKCPGRLFSVREQALILVELYRAYEVEVSGSDIGLATHSAMPRPRRPGNIRVTARTRVSQPT